MNLRGLPDFQRPIRGDGLTIFYPYEGDGHFVLAPDLLTVAERQDGRPDFCLELVRGKDTYGRLELRLRPSFGLGRGLALLRSRYPGAMLDSAVLSTGFLRFHFDAAVGDSLQNLSRPLPLALNSLGVSRFVVTLSQDNALMLKSGLQDDAFAIGAAAELEMLGVAPRVPVRVGFDPARLLGEIRDLCDPKSGIANEELTDFFRREPRSLPLEILGELDAPARDDFAEAMTDRMRTRFGTFSPSPKPIPTPYFTVASPETIGSGKFEWNLAEPVSATRTQILALHPLEAVHKLVKAEGLANVFREVTVSPLPAGTFTVDAMANVFTERPNVLSLGVKLQVPPRLPLRSQAVTVSAELKPPHDTASIVLRLSPLDKLEYTYSTYAVVSSRSGIEQREGKPTPHSGERLDLSLDDFPIRFIPVEASAELLELSTIHGVCRWTSLGALTEQEFDLDFDRSMLAMAFPRDAGNPTFDIKLRARTGGKELILGPVPADGLRLDVFSFREYGPHKVDIECVFGDSQAICILELLPEGKPETNDQISVLGFTRELPKKEWTWLAESPFCPGYRYRLRRSAGSPAATWSEVQSPFESLRISAVAGTAGGVR